MKRLRLSRPFKKINNQNILWEITINPNQFKNKIKIVTYELQYEIEKEEHECFYKNPIFNFVNFAVYLKKD